MQQKFAIALLASVGMARTSLPSQAQVDFSSFTGRYNKNYTSTSEMEARMLIWSENKARVAQLNSDNAATGVVFKMNQTGDLTQNEFKKMQGLNVPEEAKQQIADNQSNRSNGRNLQDSNTDQSINWITQGKVHEVKDQGACGSCWAFAAATVQESMQAIKNETDVIRLSEQEGVDCDQNSAGCMGGWMEYYWRMSAEIGSQSNDDYPYQATDNSCRNQNRKMIQSRADLDNYGMLGSVAEMKDRIQQGPLSIAVSAGNDCWQFYESGILSSANNCPTSLDHGVVVVGLDESGDQPYWLVQNSWGTSWGDQGFIKMAVEEGEGVCGMNTVAEYIDVLPGYPQEGPDDGSDDTDPEPEPEPQPDPDTCSIDESQNPLGPGACSSSDECRGERVCSEFGWCRGEANCPDDDTNPDDDTTPDDKCAVDETLNPEGAHTCWSDDMCQGDRTCSEWGWCEGESNCPDDDTVDPDDETIDPINDKCAIDETMSDFFREHRCIWDEDCRGERICSWDGWCMGQTNCEGDEFDACYIDELSNPLGPGMCESDDECRGDRLCNLDYMMCLGESNCFFPMDRY